MFRLKQSIPLPLARKAFSFRTKSTVVKSLLLKEFVEDGVPGPQHFAITQKEVDLEEAYAKLEEGGLILQTLAMSADPYLRNTIRQSGTFGQMKAGSPMVGFQSGKVLASKSDKWKAGDYFGGGLPFRTHHVLTGDHLKKAALWKLTGLLPSEDKISYGIGVLGMPGSTAYGGLIDILRPKQGETIFISGAAGAVGSMVGQLAKNLFNCKVIGSCGGPAKVALAKEKFGFDECIDYKTIKTKEEMVAALNAVAPDGIDMYYDNVGGIHFDAALETLRSRGRVAICGQIQEYNNKTVAPTLFNPIKMIYTQQRIEGFVCGDWLYGARGDFLKDMSRWLAEGKIRIEETNFEGIENWPLGFQSLFTGGNTGKVVIRV